MPNVSGIMGMLGGGPAVSDGLSMERPGILQSNSFATFLRALGLDPGSTPPDMLAALKEMWMKQAAGEYFGQREQQMGRQAQYSRPSLPIGSRGR